MYGGRSGGGRGTGFDRGAPGSIPGTGRFQTEIVEKPIEFEPSPWPGLAQRGAADPLKSSIYVQGFFPDYIFF